MALTCVFRSTRTICTIQHVQSLHTGCPFHAAEKALLMKLRKMCVMPPFSPTKAERWLHEEGEANKLEGRRAKERLISLFVGDKAAVMVEVNCETDFVARNEKFQQLVKDVVFATMAHHRSKNQSQTGYVKCLLAAEDLSKLNLGEGASLADQLALTVSDEAGGDGGLHISYYIHSGVAGRSDMAMGDTAPSWCSRGGKDGAQDTLGRKLGQPVVGEAPICLGSTDELPCRDTGTRLLPQSFLPDPSRTVAQYLTQQGARVLDFVRFQCWQAGSDGAY
uniref:Ts translation elongation factor, mitochondrial n=1 Tax=Salmo trutta TaxID=8032 RepID=A0A673WVU7_SALTR